MGVGQLYVEPNMILFGSNKGVQFWSVVLLKFENSDFSHYAITLVLNQNYNALEFRNQLLLFYILEMSKSP